MQAIIKMNVTPLTLRKKLALELWRQRQQNMLREHPLRQLFWECTLRCNLHCRHCGSDCKVQVGQQDMPKEDFLRVLDSVAKKCDPNKVFVVISGGEPLMRDDLEECCAEMIAVVNAEKLSGQSQPLPPSFSSLLAPNHAVVVLNVNKDEGTVGLFDPQTGNSSDTFRLSEFAEAWADSQNFMVVANEQDSFVYDPQPIEVDDAELGPELLELREAIAENAHEVWALKRRSEGWIWGPERNDSLLQTPDMTPYSNLSEEEKDYDRQMALQTLKLVQKMGYRIVKGC